MRAVAVRRNPESQWVVHTVPWLQKLEKGCTFLFQKNDQLEIATVERAKNSDGWPYLWVTLLSEWIQHVEVAYEGGLQMTGCGLKLSKRWMFLGYEHAHAAIKRGGRLVPCADCMAAEKPKISYDI